MYLTDYDQPCDGQDNKYQSYCFNVVQWAKGYIVLATYIECIWCTIH